MRHARRIAWVAAVAALGGVPAAAQGGADGLAGRLALCSNCHVQAPAQRAGADAQLTPVLRGQQADYLVRALGAYARRQRDHFFMRGIAAGLTDDEVKAIAAHFARPLPPGAAAPGATPPAMPAAAARCVACHGDGGRPPVSGETPVLAGQNATYLRRAFAAYAGGQRRHPVMQAQARNPDGSPTLGDDELAAVADWFSMLDGLIGEDADHRPSPAPGSAPIPGPRGVDR